ncbi:RidA family protein [Ralstonia insidiosa]|uniref:Enamine deaminase RidA n=1 Tax=Ralstonia insidiosa TaxID=190721 RepID=A0A191ZTT2_9RALS|nr:RidA family protein [Ralstonia insidiosa]ANJ71513.1 enamine deaminase RidA [Ralstonia insidiosa]KAB0472112.1 RidA family protein [Ralstonia insidiosa]MBY4908311.1 RidA family protein [Ralstonia insidiosa]
MTTSPAYVPAPPGLPFSTAVRAGGFLLLSGQIPFDADNKPHGGTIEEQTHAVLQSISTTLEGLGSSLRRVVKTTVWLSDLANVAAFNQIYLRHFQEGAYPARSLVEAKLAFGVAVEIEVLAIDDSVSS